MCKPPQSEEIDIFALRKNPQSVEIDIFALRKKK